MARTCPLQLRDTAAYEKMKGWTGVCVTDPGQVGAGGEAVLPQPIKTSEVGGGVAFDQTSN